MGGIAFVLGAAVSVAIEGSSDFFSSQPVGYLETPAEWKMKE